VMRSLVFTIFALGLGNGGLVPIRAIPAANFKH
jgi:hypothetical protein